MRRSFLAAAGWAVLVTACSQTPKPPTMPPPAPARPKLEPRKVAGAPAEPTKLAASDGAQLAAAWRPAVGAAKGGLVLIPMLGHTHDDYDKSADFFSGIGWGSLAVSLRGHGQSTAPGGKKYGDFTSEEWAAAGNDVAAAVAAVKEKLPGKPIVLVGASIGANLVVRYTAEHADAVAGMVLLSPGLEYHGVGITEALGQVKSKAMLLVCASDDNYSFSSSAKIQLSHNPADMTYLQYDGRDHGTDLLAHQTELLARIDTWLGKLSA